MSKNNKKKNSSTNYDNKPQSKNCCDNKYDDKETESCEKFQTYYED